MKHWAGDPGKAPVLPPKQWFSSLPTAYDYFALRLSNRKIMLMDAVFW
jgi:hypothetical protein